MKNALFLVLIILIGGTLWWFQNGTERTPAPTNTNALSTGVVHEVTLTDEGYQPESLSVSRGDAVMFVNTTGRPFWPASNLHPSHRDYPEFDPREPIPADETWTFTFEEVGEWKYHDHLAPYYTGVIIVSE